MTGLVDGLRPGVRGWVQFWFELADTRALDLVRVGVGLTLFFSYATLAAHVDALYTDDGWMPLALTPSLTEEPTSLSLLFVFRSAAAAWALWWVTIVAAALYAAGWRSNIMKWVLLVGHYSFTRRAPAVAYGVDDLCSNLLLIQCMVPMGHALAFDARRRAPLLRVPWRQTLRSMGLRISQVQMIYCARLLSLDVLPGIEFEDVGLFT